MRCRGANRPHRGWSALRPRALAAIATGACVRPSYCCPFIQTAYELDETCGALAVAVVGNRHGRGATLGDTFGECASFGRGETGDRPAQQRQSVLERLV